MSLQIVSCPECGAPAEITDTYTVEAHVKRGTEQLIHVRIACVNKHYLNLPMDML